MFGIEQKARVRTLHFVHVADQNETRPQGIMGQPILNCGAGCELVDIYTIHGHTGNATTDLTFVVCARYP
jgi:hypothetical protein